MGFFDIFNDKPAKRRKKSTPKKKGRKKKSVKKKVVKDAQVDRYVSRIYSKKENNGSEKTINDVVNWGLGSPYTQITKRDAKHFGLRGNWWNKHITSRAEMRKLLLKIKKADGYLG